MDKIRKIEVYLAHFKPKNRYDTRLANRRAPGVCVCLLGVGTYPFLVLNGPVIPF